MYFTALKLSIRFKVVIEYVQTVNYIYFKQSGNALFRVKWILPDIFFSSKLIDKMKQVYHKHRQHSNSIINQLDYFTRGHW